MLAVGSQAWEKKRKMGFKRKKRGQKSLRIRGGGEKNNRDAPEDATFHRRVKERLGSEIVKRAGRLQGGTCTNGGLYHRADWDLYGERYRKKKRVRVFQKDG